MKSKIHLIDTTSANRKDPMKTLKQFISESVPERPLDAIRKAGWSTADPGGMSDTERGLYHLVRGVNVGGDDHRFAIIVDRNKPNEYKVSHSISRGYWSGNFEDPRPYRDVHKAVHSTHQDAIADLMPRVEEAEKANAIAVKKARESEK